MELALCLPLLFCFLLCIVQVVVVVRDQLAVQLAAREAARAAAAAAATGESAQSAASRAVRLRPLEVVAGTGGGVVTVVVTHTTHTEVPIVGMFLPDVVVRASATMALEPP